MELVVVGAVVVDVEIVVALNIYMSMSFCIKVGCIGGRRISMRGVVRWMLCFYYRDLTLPRSIRCKLASSSSASTLDSNDSSS